MDLSVVDSFEKHGFSMKYEMAEGTKMKCNNFQVNHSHIGLFKILELFRACSKFAKLITIYWNTMENPYMDFLNLKILNGFPNFVFQK